MMNLMICRREYNPNVITSEFGDVVIVISLLENMPSYYSISIMVILPEKKK